MCVTVNPEAVNLDALYGAIDEVNSHDPNALDWHGVSVARSLLQGQRATTWLPKVSDRPSVALSVAARAHHLARWKIERSSYPDGRAGYLRWRKASKTASAELLVQTLEPFDVAPQLVRRAVDLVQRVGLGTDPEAQAVEDVACLVFLETDYVALLQRLGATSTAGAVRKTLKKMSPIAIGFGVEAAPVGPARDLLVEVASS
jgi:hypothetical protein